MAQIAPDLKQIKQYYEDNIKKGYTIEQITTNLKNNKYPDYVLNEAVKLIDPAFAQMSLENPKKFNYAQLPDAIKQHIQPQVQKTQQAAAAVQGGKPGAVPGSPSAQAPNSLSPDHPSNASTMPGKVAPQPGVLPPKIEAHPGLEGKSLYMFLGILGAVLIVILIVIFALGNSSDDETNYTSGASDFEDTGASGVSGTDDIDLDAGTDAVPDEPATTEDNDTNTSINETNTTSTDEDVDDTPTIIPNTQRDVSNIVCTSDSDCNDYNAMTIDSCINRACENQYTVDPEEFCVSYDNFCRPECYAYNDTDCVDSQGRKLCEEDAHCDDGDDTTNDICQNDGNYCIYTHKSQADLNQAPEFISEYNETGLELVEYTYQVEINDSENDTITYKLKEEPDDMNIDENGLLTWTPPATDNAYTTYSFIIEADDGYDKTEQEVALKIFMTEDSDYLKQECGESKTCYSDNAVALQDYQRCEFLGIYWSDPDYSSRDTCIFNIVYANKNRDLCEFIHAENTKNTCLSIT